MHKITFIYILFLIKRICLLLWHHLRELSHCNCLVISVGKKRPLNLIFDVSSSAIWFMEEKKEKVGKILDIMAYPHWH